MSWIIAARLSLKTATCTLCHNGQSYQYKQIRVNSPPYEVLYATFYSKENFLVPPLVNTKLNLSRFDQCPTVNSCSHSSHNLYDTRVCLCP